MLDEDPVHVPTLGFEDEVYENSETAGEWGDSRVWARIVEDVIRRKVWVLEVFVIIVLTISDSRLWIRSTLRLTFYFVYAHHFELLVELARALIRPPRARGQGPAQRRRGLWPGPHTDRRVARGQGPLQER